MPAYDVGPAEDCQDVASGELDLNRQAAKTAKDRQGVFGFRESVFLVLASSLTIGCMPKCKEAVCPKLDARVGNVITPDGPLPAVVWTDEELGKDVAIKTVRQTEAASYHVVRLWKAEKPHVHDRTELSVFVLSGSVNMHIGTRVVPVHAGDAIDVPRGVPHWAENASADPSFAYVVFAPPFDGKDRRPVGDVAPPSEGAH
jgi:mannose-6-phosphate isomerase-like protein (cupin superfamily)